MRGRRSLGATLFAAGALAAAVAAPAGHAQLPICPPGTTSLLYCQVGPPVLSTHALAAACRAKGAVVRVPSTAITSVAGLRTVTVTLDGKRIKRIKTSSTSFTLKGIRIPTRGLKAGLHAIVITAIDSGGRTSKHVFHFAICKPTPKFTG
jgi:hypothetical protein